METIETRNLTDAHRAVLGRLVDAFKSDSRVLSCWLGGSLGRGEGDAWSDIDLHVMVNEADFADFGETAYQLVLRAETPLMHWRGEITERFSSCTAFYENGVQVDLVVHNAAHGAILFSRPIRMVFGDEPPPTATAQPGSPMGSAKRQGEIKQRVFCFWQSALFAAKYLARGDVIMACGHLAAARGTLVQLCDLSRAVPEWCPPPIVHATWGRLTAEERAVIAGTVHGEVAALRRELAAVIDAANTLLTPLAELAACADFEARMRAAVMGFMEAAQRTDPQQR